MTFFFESTFLRNIFLFLRPFIFPPSSYIRYRPAMASWRATFAPLFRRSVPRLSESFGANSCWITSRSLLLPNKFGSSNVVVVLNSVRFMASYERKKPHVNIGIKFHPSPISGTSRADVFFFSCNDRYNWACRSRESQWLIAFNWRAKNGETTIF